MNEPENQNQIQNQAQYQQQGRVIREEDYQVQIPRENGPAAVGRGGDPLFKKINASKEQLNELLEETATVQDWVQKELCNNVALNCLTDNDLKEGYYNIKDGFGEFGPVLLMGFKTPMGVEIPRLKIYDSNGDILQVLTGPMAIDELNKRVLAYKETNGGEYEMLSGINEQEDIVSEIADYDGNI